MRELTNVLNKYNVKRPVRCKRTFVYESGSYKFFFTEGERYFVKDCSGDKIAVNAKCELKGNNDIAEHGVYAPAVEFEECLDVSAPIVKAVSQMDDPKNLRLLASFSSAMDFEVCIANHWRYNVAKEELMKMSVGGILTIGSGEECTINAFIYSENRYGNVPFSAEERFFYNQDMFVPIGKGYTRLDLRYVEKIHIIILRNSSESWMVFDASSKSSTHLYF